MQHFAAPLELYPSLLKRRPLEWLCRPPPPPLFYSNSRVPLLGFRWNILNNLVTHHGPIPQQCSVAKHVPQFLNGLVSQPQSVLVLTLAPKPRSHPSRCWGLAWEMDDLFFHKTLKEEAKLRARERRGRGSYRKSSRWEEGARKHPGPFSR